MNKKNSSKKDYIDEYKDWQDNQYNPGHFTGGNVPIWLSRPGKPKLLGIVFFTFGLFYTAWTIYKIIQLLQVNDGTGDLISIVFLGIPSIVLHAPGITLMRKTSRR